MPCPPDARPGEARARRGAAHVPSRRVRRAAVRSASKFERAAEHWRPRGGPGTTQVGGKVGAYEHGQPLVAAGDREARQLTFA